jgi:hypothetical protein
MVMSEISLDRVTEALVACLTSGRGADQVAEALNFEVKDLAFHPRPDAADLPQEGLRATLRYWQDLPQVEGVAEVAKVDPSQMMAALGYLMLVDVGEGPNEFRYRLYGTKIAKVAGFDMTGRTVWQIATSSAIQTFFAACYRAVRELRCPLYTVHRAPPHITASHWHRLILPLGQGGEVTRFLVCNIPIQNGRVV